MVESVGKKTGTRTSPIFQQKLEELCDIAQKPNGRYNEERAYLYLENLMRSIGKQKAKGFEKSSSSDQDWCDDMKFYLDQKGPRLQQMGGTDMKLTTKEKKAEQISEHPSTSTSTQEPHDVIPTWTPPPRKLHLPKSFLTVIETFFLMASEMWHFHGKLEKFDITISNRLE